MPGYLNNHKIEDSKFGINGTFAYGARNMQAENIYAGTLSGPSSYIAYELGCTYSINNTFQLNGFYRFEQWDTLHPIAKGTYPIQATLGMTNFKMSGLGLGLGISYIF